ncbi:MAG: acyl-CoA dehydrogenase family protein [Syntrophobacterales bacterium]|nr:MAG: acyl-CoA dehydrogenase family protein [Syntrophobacterales bacterium]
MVDYFQAESLLSEQEISYRDGVRKFVHEECMPVIVEHFDRESFPMELIPRMAELGLFGLHVDGYGCKKASHTI